MAKASAPTRSPRGRSARAPRKAKGIRIPLKATFRWGCLRSRRGKQGSLHRRTRRTRVGSTAPFATKPRRATGRSALAVPLSQRSRWRHLRSAWSRFSMPDFMPNGPGNSPAPRRRRHPSSAAKARIVAPTSARTTTGSAYRKATRPSGKPARLPSPSRISSPGAIARHNPGSATNDSAVEMMMTSWIARGGSTNSKKNGAAEQQSQNRSPCRALQRPLSSRPTRPSQAGSLPSRNGSSGGPMIRTHCAALPRAGPASPHGSRVISPRSRFVREGLYLSKGAVERYGTRPPLGGAALRRSIKDRRFGRGG
jgi:hypothetical protein